MTTTGYKILEERNEIDDHLLDIIGNEFKFDHEKGIAEWLKNSVDAYIRSNTPDNQQHILIRFTDGEKSDSKFECIDFNGMTSTDIDKALKRWGDPEAAKRGLQKKVYGGHGNGGKFYMRQMFKTSHFITYKNGYLNIFGFSENKKYGFADGYKNKSVDLEAALKTASIKKTLILDGYINKLEKGLCGFTVVQGVSPTGMRNKIKVANICERLKRHPQAMRLLERSYVKVIFNDKELYERLDPDVIKPLKDFIAPIIAPIPQYVPSAEAGDKTQVVMADKRHPAGRLVLKTSELALSTNSRYSELNRIDIIGELGVVASYHLRELGLYYPQTDFIYGECQCPILEDPTDDYVMNDRTKLANNIKTRALLQWIKSQIQVLCEKISSVEEHKREEINKKLSSNYNDFLNKWKNRFMTRILGDMLIGPGQGAGIGLGEGGASNNRNARKNESDKPFERDVADNDKNGGGDKPSKGSKFPRVLLSNHDDDPLNPGQKLILQPGHGLVYQRGPDVKEGIYWINTSSPLAQLIIKKYAPNSPRWRDYLFQRYVDIFIKEALFTLQRKDPERFNAVTIDGEILGKMMLKIHEAAAKDLDSFLFSEQYETAQGSI